MLTMNQNCRLHPEEKQSDGRYAIRIEATHHYYKTPSSWEGVVGTKLEGCRLEAHEVHRGVRKSILEMASVVQDDRERLIHAVNASRKLDEAEMIVRMLLPKFRHVLCMGRGCNGDAGGSSTL